MPGGSYAHRRRLAADPRGGGLAGVTPMVSARCLVRRSRLDSRKVAQIAARAIWAGLSRCRDCPCLTVVQNERAPAIAPGAPLVLSHGPGGRLLPAPHGQWPDGPGADDPERMGGDLPSAVDRSAREGREVGEACGLRADEAERERVGCGAAIARLGAKGLSATEQTFAGRRRRSCCRVDGNGQVRCGDSLPTGNTAPSRRSGMENCRAWLDPS